MDVNKLFELIKGEECETVEFKSSVSSKVAKAVTAFLNTKGGFVVVGVDDNGRLVGVSSRDFEREIADLISLISPRPQVSIEKIRVGNVLILVIKVPKSQKIHVYCNTAYVRIGSTTRELEFSELLEKAGEALLVKFDELQCQDANADDIDLELVNVFLEEKRKARNVSTPSIGKEQLFEMLEIAKKGKVTNAGVLFFCKNPQKFHPQAVIRVVEFTGEDATSILGEKTFTGDLRSVVVQTYEHLQKVIKTEMISRGFQKITAQTFPLEALQEAVANAAIHRNYFDSADTRIFIYSNKIEVVNPGSFPPDVTPQLPSHKPRNRILCQYFYDSGLTEKYGSGILKMKNECQKKGYPEPEFDIESRQTKVTFYFLPLKIREALKEIDEKNKNIVEYISKNKQVKTQELMKLTNLSKNSTVQRLKNLQKLGIVKKTGLGKATTYALA